MRTVPEEFADRLHSTFDGRLRVRWSIHEHAWVVEQKVARALLNRFFANSDRDDLIRLRDGYMQVMTVRTGDRMPCPTVGCMGELKVPVFETALIRCGKCQAQVVAGFFELNDRLIDHLHHIDPHRDASRRLRNSVEFNNLRNQVSQERYLSNVIEAGTKDDFERMAGIQSVGYTGREFTGN